MELASMKVLHISTASSTHFSHEKRRAEVKKVKGRKQVKEGVVYLHREFYTLIAREKETEVKKVKGKWFVSQQGSFIKVYM